MCCAFRALPWVPKANPREDLATIGDFGTLAGNAPWMVAGKYAMPDKPDKSMYSFDGAGGAFFHVYMLYNPSSNL